MGTIGNRGGWIKGTWASLLGVALVSVVAWAQPGDARVEAKPEKETDFYKILTFTTPPGQVLEAGAFELLPDGRVAMGTRRG